MRSFLLGFALLVVVSITVLSLRPGGIRKQMRHAARRLKLALILGGVYVAAATLARIFFPDTWVETWGPPAIAMALAAVFIVLGQDEPARDGASRP